MGHVGPAPLRASPLFACLLVCACGGGSTKPPVDLDGGTGLFGAPCQLDRECALRVCLPTKVCSSLCNIPGAPPCPTGWACGPTSDGRSACLCAPTGREVCDGLDNDCDGFVDRGATCDGSKVCQGGACVCPADSRCGNDCPDRRTDVKHCGACDNACPPTATCVAGACTCPDGQSLCGGACVDTATSDKHCGACDHPCDNVGSFCQDGACVCPEQQMVCAGVCTPTQFDVNHCGLCNRVCPKGASCNRGVCLCPGAMGIDCQGRCVESGADVKNCGACDNACPVGASCLNGVCTCPGKLGIACNGACLDAFADIDNCGACGTLCPRGAQCVAGKCGACPNQQQPCANVCTDLASDVANCGACGMACAKGASCTAGKCVCPGLLPVVCNGACLDSNSDATNCGACGNVCPAGGNGQAACLGGKCVLKCPAGFGDCDGIAGNGCEKDLTTDGANCGACGLSCRGRACAASMCDPEVLAMATFPAQIVVDAKNVYWADGCCGPGTGKVMKMPLAGGPASAVISNRAGIIGIAVDAQNLYFSEAGNPPYAISKVPLGGGMPVVLDVPVRGDNGWFITVDATNLYYSACCLENSVISVPIAGGPRQVILGNIDHPANLVVDGKDLLVVEDYSGNIIRTPAGGGNVGRTKIGPSALGLAVSGGFAYTASLGPQPQIWKLPVAGGPAVSLAAGGLTPYALATDGKWVYWVDYGEFMKKNGALYRVSVSGGPVTQLAAKLSEPEWLDIDPTYVYWTETTKVVRTPR